MSLDTWCARLAALYPDPARAAEVATTLAEASSGRRAPRLGDVLDVLWHGALARLGSTAPGTRYGVWGDAVSVAVVLALVVQAATAVAIAVLAVVRPVRTGAFGPQWRLVLFRDDAVVLVVAVTAGLAALTAGAALAGRVRATRALTLLAGAGALAAAALAAAREPALPFRSGPGVVVVGAVVALGLALVGTNAVARAAAVLPRRWAAGATACALAGALVAVADGPRVLVLGRSGLAVGAFARVVVLLTLLALPLARRAPAAFAGVLLVALPAAPLVPLVLLGERTSYWPVWEMALAGAVALVALPVAAWLAVRRA